MPEEIDLTPEEEAALDRAEAKRKGPLPPLSPEEKAMLSERDDTEPEPAA